MLTGEVIDECKKRHRHREFLSFVKTVEQQTPKDQALHVIVDNHSTHKHETVRDWLKRNPRAELQCMPTGSSWLNLVGRCLGLITEKQIRRGVYLSVRELEQRTMEFIDTPNTQPQPFAWTKTTEAIVEKIQRATAALV